MNVQTFSGSTAIGRRMHAALECFEHRDFEGAGVNMFPALDATAKKRRDVGPGKRIKEFIADNEAIISYIATGWTMVRCRFDEKTVPEVIYEMARCSLLHEGKFDDRFKVVDNGAISLGRTWEVPSLYLIAIALCVIVAPENAKESFGDGHSKTLNIERGKMCFKLEDMWGQLPLLVETLSQLNPNFMRAHRSAIDRTPSDG